MTISKSFILFLCLFLGSCSINTNLGPYAQKKASKEIRSSVVDVYSRDEIWQLKAINLGIVETDYCQNDRFGTLPSEKDLNKVLRSKTQRLGGNGIVYDHCQSGRNYMNCKLYIRCNAMAYEVTY
ncbi:hypothetical protein AADZ86_06725 [Colwelliaceae bacterium BS250]